jgi:hypothetical protein
MAQIKYFSYILEGKLERVKRVPTLNRVQTILYGIVMWIIPTNQIIYMKISSID